ncbi:hypothetical protein [Paenibacillus sp. 7541]|uniref:hypothetical protein n=1 Tax=Paenibacillus sp. 7541 TaxID=2026236 RepID=UPI0015951549|nr:hypothetical protein [Paenibacillus sp. 7541]
MQKVSETLEKYNDEKLREVDEIKHDVQKAINDLEFKIKGNQGDGPEAPQRIVDAKDKTIQELEKIKSKNNFFSSITVLGPNALLSTIKSLQSKKRVVHIQVLWEAIYNQKLDISMRELKALLRRLEEQGSIEVVGGVGSQGFIKLKD